MPPRRVIVHAGFHKTGTTSVQRYLTANGKHIWPRTALVLPARLRRGAATMAVRYSRYGTAALRGIFGEDLRGTLLSIDAGEKRSILISDENLAGRMPGREGHSGYDATPDLMAEAEKSIRSVFGADAEITFHFTTRAATPWLASTYRHNLRTSRLTLEWDAYAAQFAPAADLEGVVEAVAQVVNAPVQSARLESLSGAEGPAAPLIDLIGLPAHLRQKLVPVPSQNTGPDPDLIAELLDLNQSSLSDEAVEQAKSTLLTRSEDHNG